MPSPCNIDVDLPLDFVVRVFESPGISGKNLIRFLKWATKKDEITVTTSLVESLLLAIAGDTRRMDAYILWDLVKEVGEKENSSVLNLEILNELIALFRKIEEYDEALKLLKEMDRFGVQPNADEYNKLIQSFCLKALDWEKAEMLFEEMKQKGLHLNAITQGLIKAVKEMESGAKVSENGNLLAEA